MLHVSGSDTCSVCKSKRYDGDDLFQSVERRNGKYIVHTLSPIKTSVKWARLTTATIYHFDDLKRKKSGGLEIFKAITNGGTVIKMLERSY